MLHHASDHTPSLSLGIETAASALAGIEGAVARRLCSRKRHPRNGGLAGGDDEEGTMTAPIVISRRARALST
jgi:hypothetical protein